MDTFDQWPDYLLWIAKQNEHIHRSNAAKAREAKRYSEKYTLEAIADNKRALAIYKSKIDAWGKRLTDYYSLPWYKRIFADEPPVFSQPMRPYLRDTYSLMFASYTPEKQPSIEEYLTWRLEQ